MKRLPQCILALLLLINFPERAVAIFVATNGSDLNEGTNAKPLATITAALRKARELPRLNDVSIANGICIIVKGGVYNVTEAIDIKREDAGTVISLTYIKAATDETPVLRGDFAITH